MGTACSAHLVAKVREYIPNAKNGAVTVQIWSGDPNPTPTGKPIPNDWSRPKCDYCNALPEFVVSYYSKYSN